MKALFLSLAALALPLLGEGVRAADKPRDIDVAALLDTSGSMDGLIESAKIKLWAIVNDLAKIQPTPTPRAGPYQYGNDGLPHDTGWVRTESQFTNALAEV